MDMQQIGGYAFILGIIIAIIAQWLSLEPLTLATLLIVLGLIVGLLNVTDKETTPFLVAAIALILTRTAMVGLPADLQVITNIMNNIAVFVAPAALIVALKAVYSMAASK